MHRQIWSPKIPTQVNEWTKPYRTSDCARKTNWIGLKRDRAEWLTLTDSAWERTMSYLLSSLSRSKDSHPLLWTSETTQSNRGVDHRPSPIILSAPLAREDFLGKPYYIGRQRSISNCSTLHQNDEELVVNINHPLNEWYWMPIRRTEILSIGSRASQIVASTLLIWTARLAVLVTLALMFVRLDQSLTYCG